MPVTVKTFANFGEAASALSSDRSARYLGGGTLVMRALNEGDISISTVVRATDQALSRIDVASSRITIGAGVTFAKILAERDLAFLHAPARSIGGPAVRNMGTVGGNLFAPSPYGDFTVALLALDATVSVQGGLGARDMPIEEFLQSRERQSGALVLAVSCQRPASADAFRYRKIARIKPKGGSVITLAAHLPSSGGRISGARIALGSMAATQIRARAAERALEGRALDDAAISAAAFRYRKIARIKPKGGSVITLAAHLPSSGGRISGARIALGSMAATQIRARAAERALEGRSLDEAAISAAAAAATEGVSPADNALGSAWYRREIVGVHLRRLLSGLE